MLPISYQLYSSRASTSVEATLEMLSTLGYRHVEGYGALLDTPAQAGALAASLEACGLSMPSAHIALEDLEQRPDHVRWLARRFGLEIIVSPYLAPEARPTDATGWQEIGKRLARATAWMADAGLVAAWHNHDFEIVPLSDGSFPLDHLLSAAPEVQVELDVGWVHRAGQDPVDWIGKLADRLASVHIKDAAPAGENADEGGWADPGDGVLDWDRIMPAVRASTARILIVEHDLPSDDSRFAAAALRATQRFAGAQ